MKVESQSHAGNIDDISSSKVGAKRGNEVGKVSVSPNQLYRKQFHFQKLVL